MRQCCLLLLLWALSGSLFAAPPEPTATQALAPLEITRDSPRINLTSHLLLLEDPAGTLTANRLLQGDQHLPWRQVRTRFVNEGKNQSVWWLQFALHNTSDAPVQGVLQVDYALLDTLNLYQQTPDGTLLSKSEATIGRSTSARWASANTGLPCNSPQASIASCCASTAAVPFSYRCITPAGPPAAPSWKPACCCKACSMACCWDYWPTTCFCSARCVKKPISGTCSTC
ncbi:7TM-DISM domain-containing protein [Halopseudomonas pachastrellae]|nr:7TM-DISM domain-containing protein [Halopseudomonas pachastrellae]